MYRNGSVYSAADPLASAMLVDGDTVAWVGTEAAAASITDSTMRVVDLDGALVAPGFVDSHAHLMATGVALDSLDLASASSLTDLLDAVSRAASATTGVILGHGWDETRWPENRPPTAAELSRASGGREVYLSRIDVHSAAVSDALADRLGLAGLVGWDGDGVVRGAAMHTARAAAFETPAGGDRQRLALARAAANGYVAVAEMATDHGGTMAQLRDAVALNASGTLPEVLPYWGAAAESTEQISRILADLGLEVLGLAGDITIDGSIGSRSALLRQPYADAPADTGRAYLSVEQVTNQLAAASELGVQTGFHIIGDGAMDIAVESLHKAAERVGIEKVRAARHRFEHVEMLDDAAIDAMAAHAVTASVQPLFDAAWAGPGGLYETRLGADRAAPMNPYARLLSAGVPVCLGSDSPVTAPNPWQAVRACLQHHNPSQRISARAAFTAHTRAGWRAARSDNPLLGQLVPGAPASFAVWEADELMVQTPDDRVQAWSTDPRARTPLLPALDTGSDPRCLLTCRDGSPLYAVDGYADGFAIDVADGFAEGTEAAGDARAANPRASEAPKRA